jgi:hypothetical protein
MNNSKLIKVWRSMQHRCYNTSQKSYKDYGAKGVVVCERWLGSNGFENFVTDMGEKPEGYTIDRINVNGNYEPSNCRWASREEQANNKRTTRYLTLGDKTQTLAQWARELGCTPSAILLRLKKMSVEKALTTPVPERANAKLTMDQARYARSQYPMRTLQDIATELSVSKKTILNIMHNRIFVEVVQ